MDYGTRGGYCNRALPDLGEAKTLESFDWEMRNIQVQEIEELEKMERSKGISLEL